MHHNMLLTNTLYSNMRVDYSGCLWCVCCFMGWWPRSWLVPHACRCHV